MPLTINTNISSLIAQRNLNNATSALNSSIERLTTGYTINHASDNAAGYSIANLWNTKISSLDVASDNAATGADLLQTAEESYGLLTAHLQRIRDLTEQAANGTYGSQSLRAIHAEIVARFSEIDRISANAEFNGVKLMAYDTSEKADNSAVGMTEDGINLQVGLYADENSRINLAVDLFTKANLTGLFKKQKDIKLDGDSSKSLNEFLGAAGAKEKGQTDEENMQAVAAACVGMVYSKEAKKGAVDNLTLQTDKAYGAKEMLKFLDNAINDVSGRVTKIGAVQNRITSAISAIGVQSQNLISSLSTLRDTDVAEESSNFIQSEILQQASATLLSTANQLPSIALNLI